MHGKQDKRIHKRFSMFTKVFSCRLSEKKCVNLVVKDISTTGIGMRLDSKFEKGDIIELEIIVPGDDIPIFVAGEIAWIVPEKNGKGTYLAGVRLVRIERNDKNRLVKFLHNGFAFLE
jgi:Tfp pilus assembly protein PilZ